MIRRRSMTLLTLAALAAIATTQAAAAPPPTVIEDPAPGPAVSFDVTTGAVFTCTIEPGPISSTSTAFTHPDNFTAIAMRVPTCATCPDPQTLDLKTISIRIRWLRECAAQAEVSVVRAVSSGGCLVPDPTQVLCGPVVHAISSPGSVGIIHTLPIPTGCCVSGNAFVLVRFIDTLNCSIVGSSWPFLTRMSDACVNCQAFFTTAVNHPTMTDWCTIAPTGLWWRLESDCCAATGVDLPLPGAPGLQLTIAPNPATATAELMFEVPSGLEARLEIFDLTGRRCATVAAGTFGEGVHRAMWRGELDAGGTASPGVYRARLTSSEGTLTRQILWLPR